MGVQIGSSMLLDDVSMIETHLEKRKIGREIQLSRNRDERERRLQESQ